MLMKHGENMNAQQQEVPSDHHINRKEMPWRTGLIVVP